MRDGLEREKKLRPFSKAPRDIAFYVVFYFGKCTHTPLFLFTPLPIFNPIITLKTVLSYVIFNFQEYNLIHLSERNHLKKNVPYPLFHALPLVSPVFIFSNMHVSIGQ